MAENITQVRSRGMTFPDDTSRTTIIGATGSGKTHAGIWHLSLQDFDRKPWVIIDFKRDKLIAQIQGAQYIALESPVPTQPGIYIVQPVPEQDDDVSEFLMRVWASENTGVYVDEAYMIGKNNKGFRALLTQGRSKHIPMIVNTQRPVWIDRFVMSESSFIQVFRLTDRDDLKVVQRFIPYAIDARLPERHSYYYDVAANHAIVLGAVPDMIAITSTFDMKLRRIRKVV